MDRLEQLKSAEVRVKDIDFAIDVLANLPRDSDGYCERFITIAKLIKERNELILFIESKGRLVSEYYVKALIRKFQRRSLFKMVFGCNDFVTSLSKDRRRVFVKHKSGKRTDSLYDLALIMGEEVLVIIWHGDYFTVERL